MAHNAMDLSAALGTHVRELRTSAGIRQDDIAAAARSIGLAWSRSVVAALESGRRQLSAEDLLLLPVILNRVGIEVSLPTLLERLGTIRISEDTTLPSRRLARIARGDPDWGERITIRIVEPDGDKLEAALRAVRESGGHDEQALQVAGRLFPDALPVELRHVEQAASGEAEQRAARRFGVSPLVVALVAHHLWGRSLTAERDARFAAAPYEASVTQSQGKAHRGWITRELLAELEPAIHDVIGEGRS